MQHQNKKELPKLKLKVDFTLLDVSQEKEQTSTSLSSSGIELDDHNEYFIIGDEFYGEVSTKKNGRTDMEDRFSAYPNYDGNKSQFFFAVYDGHGGSFVARLLSKNLHNYLKTNQYFQKDIELAIHESFKELNSFVLTSLATKGKGGGSTALCALNVLNTLYIINLGDSTCYSVNKQFKFTKLNSEHKPSRSDEAERIQQQGFIIYNKNVARIDGELAVSRSFGDNNYIKSGVIADPEITQCSIQSDDRYLLLGTDGFWDLTNETELEQLLIRWDELSEGSMENITQYLLNHVTQKHTTFKKDNMTLMVIDLTKYFVPSQKIQ